ncbi:hypothetical protein EFV61_18895 [Yersinia enterocolitica]|nr:hypothetical protein [Yersinia enterocolitica]EKN4927377.1 hypothetical protein [Yersinia enterocolitica]EKN4932631.1 hypothetical protein [Yersinia enterocolitica]EKN5014467.1 hypothetical protein [Yersinia enterocolitica]EKN5026012.1 hypothetical protein [Yersinia enterocolitica]
MIRVTNRSETDLNAVCIGLAEARPMDGPSNQSSQRTCILKHGGYIYQNAGNHTMPRIRLSA